eukprot:scaffold197648_cov31-Tisochrysis_lutea.AAC.1
MEPQRFDGVDRQSAKLSTNNSGTYFGRRQTSRRESHPRPQGKQAHPKSHSARIARGGESMSAV